MIQQLMVEALSPAYDYEEETEDYNAIIKEKLIDYLTDKIKPIYVGDDKIEFGGEDTAKDKFILEVWLPDDYDHPVIEVKYNFEGGFADEDYFYSLSNPKLTRKLKLPGKLGKVIGNLAKKLLKFTPSGENQSINFLVKDFNNDFKKILKR